jgi:hypothetical protein
MKEIFKYSYNDVENAYLADMVVRSPSGKGGINTNRKLFVFLLHGSKIYFYARGLTELKFVSETSIREFIKTSSEDFWFTKLLGSKD